MKNARPCKLQVNTTGAWRNVLAFDAQDGDEVMHLAHQLFSYDTHCARLKGRVIADGDTAPLEVWTMEEGWRTWHWDAVA